MVFVGVIDIEGIDTISQVEFQKNAFKFLLHLLDASIGPYVCYTFLKI